jgi:hypothetical protein
LPPRPRSPPGYVQLGAFASCSPLPWALADPAGPCEGVWNPYPPAPRSTCPNGSCTRCCCAACQGVSNADPRGCSCKLTRLLGKASACGSTVFVIRGRSMSLIPHGVSRPKLHGSVHRSVPIGCQSGSP